MKHRLAAALLATAVLLAPGAARAGEVLVFAAASLREALEEAAARWQEATGHRAILSFAGSSALARQIEAGAPADLYLSANEAWVDVLDRGGLLRPGSRRDLLTNRLVMVSHRPVDEAGTCSDLPPQTVGEGARLAMALVEAVPAGIYGKAALQSLGWWQEVESNVVQADNVRAALALVATGEAATGIVYATDAVAEARVTLLCSFPEESHPPIRYPMAIPADSTATEAEALADFLAGPEAAAVFRAHGFGIVDRGTQ